MPACKVGCCPVDECDCSIDCECVLSKDTDISEGVELESPFLIGEHEFKGIAENVRLKICLCRTKEELADYVKPIETRLHAHETENELGPPEKQEQSNTETVDNCCQTGLDGEEKGEHTSTYALCGQKDECCDDDSCTKSAERENTLGETNTNCCADDNCQEKCDNPLENTKHHHHTAPESCCEDDSCREEEGKECCGVKSSKCEAHVHVERPKENCSNDKDCGTQESTAENHKSTQGNCCETKGSGGNTPCEETNKHSHTENSCCGEKSGGGDSYSGKEQPSCCDERRCKSSKNASQNKVLPRTFSLPTNNSSNPNSPTKFPKVPNIEVNPNFKFETSPTPYRKTKRSQSLAEARLGSLLSLRRPSCFQLSFQELRAGTLPDPHRGHLHHHDHEYHHHGNHHNQSDHHHNHSDHHHHGNHDDTHHHGNGSCCQAKDDRSPDSKSCCEDPNCGEQSPSSNEELEPLMKNEGPKVDVSEMVFRTTKLRVQNLCCPKEAAIVQDELLKLEGVNDIRVNVIGRVVHVTHFAEIVSPTALMMTLNKRHLGVSIVDTGSEAKVEKGLPKSLKTRLANLAVQSVLIAIALGGLFSSSSWYMWVAIVEICFGIVPILKKVYRALQNLEIDLNILITITVIGTLAIQEWIEGAAVVFVFTVAGFLQRYCFYRVQKTISGLMLSKPSKAVMACTGDCIPVEDVPIGSIIAVRQGELIPLDGIVVKGVASVDESSISGEATPVEKILDSSAYSGTVIQNGYLEIETTSSSTSSTISKIAAMVEDAQINVSPTEIMVNKFAKFYTPLVICVAVLVFIIPLCLGLGGVQAYDGHAKTWGKRALIILVTACPCALLMATPTVVICGINGAARLGALIKGGTFLEALGQLNVLALDKTGTLTEGKFQVVDLVPTNNHDESDVLRWAAALESKSSHPLAAAVVNEFTGECVSDFVADSDFLPDVTDFQTLEGQGISGKVEGHDVQVGNKSLLEKYGVSLSPKFEAAFISFSTDAKTVIFVCVDGELALMISLADIIRWESRAALSWLQDLGVHLCMLTGDAKPTANAVQKELQLDSCVSDMKPDDKLNWINNVKDKDIRQRTCGRFRKKRSQLVGMVGDGVNDGPALAASDVGIAMAAGGSALAVEAAGVALMNNSVLKIPEMICLSRFCRRVILQNIILSVGLKLVFVIIALTGFVRVWMAVLADLVGLVAVILNGLRPLKWKPPRTKRKSEPPRASFRRKRPIVMYETVV